MIRLLSSKNKNIQNNTTCYFEKTSVDYIDVLTLYIASSTPIVEAKIKFREGSSKYIKFVVRKITIGGEESQNILLPGEYFVNGNFVKYGNQIEYVEDHEELSDLVTNIVFKDIEELNEEDLINANLSEYGNFYQLMLKFSPEDFESEELTKLFSSVVEFHVITEDDEKTIQFNVVGEAERMSEELTVTLQNLKKQIDDEYIVAFAESDSKSKEINRSIYNRKIREYLLNIYELSALHGSYKNLFSVLKFFGYGDMLDLKEHWTDRNGQYKSTSIYNIVHQYLDKSLTGFYKTNMMSLVYQINDEDGVDDDGLPIYTNVYHATNRILLKLHALKNILERDFLHFNTHIVDIIGEFQTVVGQELYVLSNLHSSSNINLSDNLNLTVDFKLKNSEIFIETNSVILNENLKFKYDTDNDDLGWVDEIVSYDDKEFFEIKSIADIKTSETEENDENDESYDNFEVLTKFYTGTFGIIETELDFDSERYQSYRYIIVQENGDILYDSKIRNIDNINENYLFGIRKTGKFSLILYLIDHYGNISVCGTNQELSVYEHDVNIFLGEFTEEISNFETYKTIDEWSTFSSTGDDVFLVPSIKNSINYDLDINSWDSVENNPELIIEKTYSKNYDKLSTYCSINQLNSLPIEQLKGIPLHSWGSTYCIGVVDIIGDSSQEGERSLTIKLINDADISETITKYWDGSVSESIWITEFIQQIKNSSILYDDSVYNNFTYDVSYYDNSEYSEIYTTRPMLRFRSVEASFKSRFLSVDVITYPIDDFPESYFLNDEFVFSCVDAKLEFAITEPSISNLMMFFEGEAMTVISANISTVDDLLDILNNPLAFYSKYIFAMKGINEDTIIIYSKKDITLSHSSFGIQSDTVRARQFKFMKQLRRGANVQIGKPFIATISKSSKFDIQNIYWKLIDEMTYETITEQTSLVFKYILSKETTYTLELTYTSNGEEHIEQHRGIIICHNEI